MKVGKAIDADVPEETRFHRTNCYYLGLQKNFQITRYDEPANRNRLHNAPTTFRPPQHGSRLWMVFRCPS